MDDVKPDGRRKPAGTPTRRTFLWGVGGASALMLGLGDRDDAFQQIDPNELDANPIKTLSFDVVRAQDALVLTVDLYNYKIVPTIGSNLAYLTLDGTAPSGYLVATFPPQSIGEQAVPYFDDPTVETYRLTPDSDDNNGYRARAFDNGQPTRLAFVVAEDLALSLDGDGVRKGLLDWGNWTSNSPLGIPSGAEWDGPSPYDTSVGAPYGVALSPDLPGRWLHRNTPVTDAASKVTEIWHTRLGAEVNGEILEYPLVQPTARVIFSDNFKLNQAVDQTQSSTGGETVPVSSADAAAFVHLTENFSQLGGAVEPVDIHRLMLTSAGAWVDLHGAWSPPSSPLGINVTGWDHRSTQGRDHEVVVTYAGYLLPFGHAVTLVKRSVRRFEAFPTGTPVANIRQSTYLIIRRQDRYLNSPYNPDGGVQLPFTRVRLNVTTTPDLRFANLPGASGSASCDLPDGTPYMFAATAWDWEGNKHSFSMPMVFVTASAATGNLPGGVGGVDIGNESGNPIIITGAYNQYAAANGSADLFGKSVAMAPSSKSGDTTVRIDTMTFGIRYVDPSTTDFLALDYPCLFPIMQGATGRVPAVETVSSNAATTISYHDTYVNQGGFGTAGPANGEVFLEIDSGPALNFNKGGNGTHPGVITPNLPVRGLSRSRGPVGDDLANYDVGKMDPFRFFGGDAKLLGGLSLASIIAAVADLTDLSNSPIINSLRNFPTKPDGTPDLAQPPTITTTISWAPDLQDSSPSLPVFKQGTTDGGPNASLTFTATIVATPTGPPMTDVTGDLRNFTLQLFNDAPMLILEFKEFSFHARNGAKPTVHPSISKVSFGGDLEFINALEQFLPSGPGGNGISVTPTGITASTSVAIPSVSFGVFNLTNLSLNAGVTLPFTGDPASVSFSFCTRDKPFLLSVLIFGGGGYVGVILGTNGLQQLDAGFDFGAHMGIDLGIVSGAIEVMAGINFQLSLTQSGQETMLTGFVKAHGELNLAVVAISLTFYLSLQYVDLPGGKKGAAGEVDVSLDIRVLVFSVNVSFTVRKQFAGGGDPNFYNMYTPTQWLDYAAAFGGTQP